MITRHPIAAFSRRLLAGAALLSLPAISTSRAETFTLEEATIDQIQKAMADGALSSVELTSLYLNRIAIYDRNGIKLNSVVQINPEALQEAAATDLERATAGAVGPLHGIPFGVKDEIAVAGLPLTGGEKVFKNFVPNRDAFVVEQLKSEGAIALGMTNMITAASGANSSESETYGQTRNPYTLLSAGGSSCGSGAAVGANLVSFALAIENNGSIRYPAIVSGSVGLTPTRGLVSNQGTSSIWRIQQYLGPITKTVKESAQVLDVLARRDPDDAMDFITPSRETIRPATYTANLGSRRLDGIKFGVPVPFNAGGTGALEIYQPGVVASFQQALAELRALGAEVVEVTIPGVDNADFDDALLNELGRPADYDFYESLENADYDIGAIFQANQFLSLYSDSGLTFGDTAVDRVFYRLGEDYDEFYDAIGVADAAGFEDALQTAGLLKEAKDSPRDVAYLNAMNAYYRQTAKQAMDELGLDALLTPGLQNDVWKFEDPDDYTVTSVAILSMPFVSMPMPPILGSAENTASSITPQGILMIGRQFDEAALYSYASAYEAATRHRVASTLTPPLPGETIEYSTALPPPSRPELNAPALRVAAGAKVAGKGKKATLVLTGGAVDASGLAALTVYVNGKKIAAKKAKNWKASVKLSALRSFVKGSAKTVQVTVVAKDVYGNTSVTTKTVKLPKTV